MNIRFSRFLIIIFIGAIPFLIAGLFVFRYVFPGASIHPAMNLFLASSVIPSIASMGLAIVIQILPFHILRSDAEEFKARIALILTGIALVPILWGVIAATEAWLRSFYFGLVGSYVLDFSPMSTSSIVMGVVASILIIRVSIQPAIKIEAA